MYPALREDHLRYLQKWGFIRSTFRNNADKYFEFGDLTLLRQVHADLQQGASFRGILRDLQASRCRPIDIRLPDRRRTCTDPRRSRRASGPPARPLRPAWRSNGSSAASSLSTRRGVPPDRIVPDDGRPERQEEAAQAYRHALERRSESCRRAHQSGEHPLRPQRTGRGAGPVRTSHPARSSYFEAHFNLGNIHHDHGRYTDAEQCYAEALALNPRLSGRPLLSRRDAREDGPLQRSPPHWRDYQDLAPQGEWVELRAQFSD